MNWADGLEDTPGREYVEIERTEGTGKIGWGMVAVEVGQTTVLIVTVVNIVGILVATLLVLTVGVFYVTLLVVTVGEV